MNDSIVDPLTSSNFDVIAYINNRFPNEQSLNELDKYSNEINSKINLLDEELSRAVQAQSKDGEQGSKVY
jgi:hypothetical protein